MLTLMPLRVHGLCDAYSIFNRRTRHEASRDAATYRRALGKIPQRTIFGKSDKKGPQHGIPATGGGMSGKLFRRTGKEPPATRVKITEFCITTGDWQGVSRNTFLPHNNVIPTEARYTAFSL